MRIVFGACGRERKFRREDCAGDVPLNVLATLLQAEVPSGPSVVCGWILLDVFRLEARQLEPLLTLVVLRGGRLQPLYRWELAKGQRSKMRLHLFQLQVQGIVAQQNSNFKEVFENVF